MFSVQAVTKSASFAWIVLFNSALFLRGIQAITATTILLIPANAKTDNNAFIASSSCHSGISKSKSISQCFNIKSKFKHIN